MFALVLVAAALGIGNFAAAVSLGLDGVTNRLRVEVGLVFGILEGIMPAIGLFLGHSFAHLLGNIASPLGGSLLALLGFWNFLKEQRKSIGKKKNLSIQHDKNDDTTSTSHLSGEDPYSDTKGLTSVSSRSEKAQRGVPKLIFTGVILAMDNLVVGFALGAYHVSVVVAAVTIGVISGLMSLLGLEVGKIVGNKIGRYGEMISSIVLIFVGVAIGFGYL